MAWAAIWESLLVAADERSSCIFLKLVWMAWMFCKSIQTISQFGYSSETTHICTFNLIHHGPTIHCTTVEPCSNYPLFAQPLIHVSYCIGKNWARDKLNVFHGQRVFRAQLSHKCNMPLLLSVFGVKRTVSKGRFSRYSCKWTSCEFDVNF